MTSPHSFCLRSRLLVLALLAPRSVETGPPLAPPRKVRFEILVFKALCRASPLKNEEIAMCPHVRAHPNLRSIHN